MIDPWVAVSGLTGAIVSAGLVWLRETMTMRRDHGVRSEERARLEGEIVATLRTHGDKLDRIQRRVDALPCADCQPRKEPVNGARLAAQSP